MVVNLTIVPELNDKKRDNDNNIIGVVKIQSQYLICVKAGQLMFVSEFTRCINA